MDFTKRFNVGLTLETGYEEFKSFLEKYHSYIHSVYFSPPVDRRLHTRTKVSRGFLIPGKKRQFWKMLSLLRSYGIELELLFNTLLLDEALIRKTAQLLEEHQVSVDSVCFLTDYYDAVLASFPGKKYILSFNNGYQKKSQIDRALENYAVDAVVLGSSFIRDNELFAELHQRGIETYLLLNNGCSFHCGTCNNVLSVCEQSFYKNLEQHSVEYLYALQSIFPHELRDGTIDPTHIRCFKISNRSSNLKFLQGAMDSYITGRVDDYIRADHDNYAFWGRAGYFWKYFPKLDLQKIREYKEQILQKDASERLYSAEEAEGETP